MKKRNKVERGAYLSHSLTFLQLLVQQPADIKAVTKTDGGRETQEDVSFKCVVVTREEHLINRMTSSWRLSVRTAKTRESGSLIKHGDGVAPVCLLSAETCAKRGNVWAVSEHIPVSTTWHNHTSYLTLMSWMLYHRELDEKMDTTVTTVWSKRLWPGGD